MVQRGLILAATLPRFVIVLLFLTCITPRHHCMSFAFSPFRVAGRSWLSRRTPWRDANRMCRTSLFSSASSSNECALPYEKLPYMGVEVRIESRGVDNSDDGELLQQIRSSIDYWQQKDFNSAWLHIPSSRSSLMETLTNDEFSFDLHHVNSTESTIVLKKWLRPNDEDKVPPFATHQVGCAGFVLNDKNELLLVKEWTGPLDNRTPTNSWKLPGGLLDAGETFEEAASREVWEETGIKCDFESVLAFWHRHGLVFGKSDFYFVCLMKPKTHTINLDPNEISAATWMPLHEFVKTQKHPLIWHVLKNAYHVGGDGQPGVDDLQSKTERLTPVVEMSEGIVRFGDRPGHLTYTGNTPFIDETEH